jgi:hypothetical protein
VLLSTSVAAVVNGAVVELCVVPSDVNGVMIKGFPVDAGVSKEFGGGPSIGLISICFSWEFMAECNASRVRDGVRLGGPSGVLGERPSNLGNIPCSNCWSSSKTSSKAMPLPSLLGESIGTVLTDTSSEGVLVIPVSISPRGSAGVVVGLTSAGSVTLLVGVVCEATTPSAANFA